MLCVYGGSLGLGCGNLERCFFAGKRVTGEDGLSKGRVSCVSVFEYLDAPFAKPLSAIVIVSKRDQPHHARNLSHGLGLCICSLNL